MNPPTIACIVKDRPSFHQGETEIARRFSPSESFLDHDTAEHLATRAPTCHGIDEDVLLFLGDNVGEESRTLETGAGCSTLVFALGRSHHIAITPNCSEIELITAYANAKDIPMDRVRFIPEPSERYLPTSDASNLDLVLLDGKHAFPWPVVDWFFTADRLRNGGVMVVDDAHMRAVQILVDFMRVDSGWKTLRDFSGKTVAFQKIRDSIHDVAWHMQPWMNRADVREEHPPGLLQRALYRFRRTVPRT